MKKTLLIFCSLLASATFSNVKAQDLDADFLQYFGAHAADFGKTTAKDALGIWRSQGATGTRIVGSKGVTAYVGNTSRYNNMVQGNEPDDINPTALRLRIDNDACDIIIESANADLTTLALQYRGDSDANPGNFKISYGASASSPLTTETLTPVTSASPGQVKFFNFPVDPFEGTTLVRYVKIQRAAGVRSMLYRIAASTTTFTSLPLPLDFLSFTAKANNLGNSVNLNWKTANEVNTKEFIVERGTNTTDFKAIGTLASANTAGEHNYNFVDAAALAGTSYYRIKQVDKDGKFDYSEVQEVSVKGGVSLSVYPNPTSDVLNISHQAAANATLKVLNVQGQAVINQAVASGSVLTNLSISSLASGVYTLILNNAGGQSAVKFVKN